MRICTVLLNPFSSHKQIMDVYKGSDYVYPLYTGNSYTGTFINSVNPDNAVFHQGLHCLLIRKKYLRKKYIVKIIT